MARHFLGKYVSITAVDLIQLKTLDSRNFYESNSDLKLLNSLPFYSNSDGIWPQQIFCSEILCFHDKLDSDLL